ncbi:ketopantoate reductase family protein [Aeromicrobium endophyticum]|uniref:Ketopantoate reductase family protein n=1 Tax=Aeromicrobium endophyticum TaxID=2292704 RepID=A0A371PED8_9ACTN|nr:2-dehydropantoate 2-reductase N-terminal domain-containing protein [Aeromicrobium endophyticum]REK73770.1 ketopantoate reductase family protein [Aeromicrobium endophyticum]
MSERRYVIIGGGAIGGALAAQLVPAGHDVVLVARGEHGRVVAEHGLTVRRPNGVDVVEIAVAVSSAEVRLRPSDVLVLATKAQDAEAALVEWAWQPVGGGGVAADLPIVTFQNGLATEDLALRRFSRVYGATIAIAASFTTPGEIVSPSLPPAVGAIWVGRYPSGLDDLARSLVDDLVGAGFHVTAVDDVRQAKAAKLLGNVGNGLDLLDGDDAARAEARAVLKEEAAVVLGAAGLLSPADAPDLSATPLKVLPVDGHVGGRLSTWQSFARGASSEVDYLNGEIVLLARRAGLSAPLNERLQRLLGDATADRTLDALVPQAAAAGSFSAS